VSAVAPEAAVAGETPQTAAPGSPATIAYYPGCSLHGTSREFDESLRAVLAALRVPIAEIDDWSCCGASSGHTTDHLLGVALPARNLALAEAQGFGSVLAPCAACYNRLSAARLAVAGEPGTSERVVDALGRPFANTVAVQSVVQLLREAAAIIEEKAAAALTPNPLGGLRLAAYYGCLLVRPPEIAGDDDPEAPTSMDEVITACGADAVDWNMKVECCGGAFSVSRTSSVVRLGRAIIADARRNGAEAIVVACPLCHSNLDLRQKAMMARGEEPVPVLFITQVVGLALGLPAAALGLDRHFVDTEPFIRRLVAQAAVRAVEEEKVKAEAAAKAAARRTKAAEAPSDDSTGLAAAADAPTGDIA
jgi:heterodisulfide reductase subunit B